MTDRILNWQPQRYDHRHFQYDLSKFITDEQRARASLVQVKDWYMSRIFDQGSSPHCVGYAWAGFGVCAPVEDDWPNSMGDDIYYQAKIEDGDPGAENGSTSLSGVKAFMHFGQLKNGVYAWATTLDDIAVWVSDSGPVCTGTAWYTGMMAPDANGFIHPTGKIEGGHEWLITGVDKTKEEFHLTNSWGAYWGNGGQAKISYADYEAVWKSYGDACTTLEVSSSPEPAPEVTAILNVVLNVQKDVAEMKPIVVKTGKQMTRVVRKLGA